MDANDLCITYPPVHSGAEKTAILYHTEIPDLVALYHPGSADSCRRFFVTDGTVATLSCMQPFTAKFDDGRCGHDYLLILGSGEPYKTIESVLTIIKCAIDEGFSRKDLFVGIGGGVICDLTGFAASVFKRGAAVEFVPTTLLAMVDASIGGKTGCDFDSYKNMIGAFFPAQTIHLYPQFVNSLSDSQFNSGLAEAFKTGLLYDKDLYYLMRDHFSDVNARSSTILNDIIIRCARAKGQVVEQDFLERSVRMNLNFGHTFGHALETVIGLGAITHGSAVAWGIGRALALSASLGLCSDSYRDEVFIALKQYGWDTDAVPHILRGGNAGGRILEAMHKDKKNSSDTVRVIMQRGLTDTVIQETSDESILAVLK